MLKHSVCVFPSSNADEIGWIVKDFCFHIDIVVFLIARRQIFVRSFFMLNFKRRFSFLAQNSQLQTSLDDVLTFLADVIYFLHAVNISFHKYSNELLEETDLSFSLFFDWEDLHILRFFIFDGLSFKIL